MRAAIDGRRAARDLARLYGPPFAEYGDAPIALSARSTVAELAAISRREGFEHTLDPLGLSDQGPGNRVSPFCGCKLIYPATPGAAR